MATTSGLSAGLERMERSLPRRRARLLADGEAGVGQLAQRLAGSSESLPASAGRAPQAGINFITAHDGFTLRDLVSYQTKHNELNGEDNRDGHGHNLLLELRRGRRERGSAVLERRRRLQRALLATLMIAQGVPMLQSGDELGRTQAGNNNAYCQDNAMTWLDWRTPMPS
jgi:pullulanase/glycogen debranching enzyme